MNVSACHCTKDIGPDRVLDDVSLQIESGSVVGLAGGNGSGKTMLMRVICGLVSLTSGEVQIDGRVLRRDIEFPPSVGLFIDSPSFLSGKSGFSNLKLLASLKGNVHDAEIHAAMTRVGLNPELKKAYRGYSLGMKQRLGIAAAIMEKPDLIILDEPTNALDVHGVEMLKSVVAEERARGAAILISSHDAGTLNELADCIYTMDRGRVVNRFEGKARCD